MRCPSRYHFPSSRQEPAAAGARRTSPCQLQLEQPRQQNRASAEPGTLGQRIEIARSPRPSQAALSRAIAFRRWHRPGAAPLPGRACQPELLQDIGRSLDERAPSRSERVTAAIAPARMLPGTAITSRPCSSAKARRDERAAALPRLDDDDRRATAR